MLRSQIICLFLLCVSFTYSQNKITGTVYNEYLEPIYNAKIKTNKGVFRSDTEGEVSFKLKGDFPQKISVTFDGCDPERIIVSEGQELFTVVLKAAKSINKIVVSASRTPERILESPSDVFRLGPNRIKSSIGSAYESMGYLPGVQLINNYFGFKSINTRGFSQFDNSRFVQQIDGMDSSIPASFLNQGDLGLPIDLDLQSIEILPGSASALYGANAYNGLMLINTKNPFDNRGIDVKFKTGVAIQGVELSPTYQFSMRNAYKFSDNFAAKITFSYNLGEQWAATDYRNIDRITDGLNNKKVYQISDYNGVNTYGDEETKGINLDHYADKIVPGKPSLTNFEDIYLYMARTGFYESELLNEKFKNKSIRFNNSLNFRPFSNKSLEFILANNISISDKIVQSQSSRFGLKNFYMIKSKFEFKGDNFFVRLSRSKNKTDEAYDLKRLGVGINEKLITTNMFAGDQYINGIANLLLFNKQFSEITPDDLKTIRTNADNSGVHQRKEYQKFLEKFKNTSILEKYGSQIYDHSSYINLEANYNVSSLLNNIVNFQIGGSYRKSDTDSRGTLFNDLNKEINIEEYGAYTQIQKKIIDERLKFTGSIRYDKNQNFKANISPRLAVNWIIGENKNYVLRGSYQTGFRNPNMQELYSNNKLGLTRHIVGTAPDNDVSLENIPNDVFVESANGELIWRKSKDFAIKDFEKYKLQNFKPNNTTLNDVINNSFIGHPFRETNNSKRSFTKNTYGKIHPEKVKTYELGFRSLFKLNYSTNLDVKISSYYSEHEDFIYLLPVTTNLFGKIHPKGQEYFTDNEIDKIKLELGDHYGLISSPNEEGLRQYIGSDMSYFASSIEGMFREVSLYTNMKSKVNSYGFNVSAKTTLFSRLGLDLDVNYSFMDYKLKKDEDNGFFKINFNAPKHSAKLQLSSKKILGNIGFNIGGKWSDSYYWQSQFASTEIPSRVLVDAQLSYNINKLMSTINIGGTNLGGKDYQIAPGAGLIGKSFYISWVIQN